MLPPELALIDYRNGLYQGGLVNHKRQGKGLLLTDANQLFVGEWVDDLLTGGCLIIRHTGYTIAHFVKGELDGDYCYYDQHKMVYLSFARNLPKSNIVLVDKSIQNSSLLEVTEGKPTTKVVKQLACKGMSLSKVVSALMEVPANLPTLKQFVEESLVSDKMLAKKELSHSSLYVFADGTFAERVGFQLGAHSELLSMGVYLNDVLHGMGALYQKHQSAEGTFRFGLLHGVGLKGSADSKQVLGHFVNGDIRQVEQVDKVANPVDIATIKSKMHLKSPNFFNTYILSQKIVKYATPAKLMGQLNKKDAPAKENTARHSQQKTEDVVVEKTHLTATPNKLADSRRSQQRQTPVNRDNTKTPVAKLTASSTKAKEPDFSLFRPDSSPKIERQARKDAPIIRTPIMTVQKASMDSHQNHISLSNQVASHSTDPETELQTAHRILNKMNDPNSELEQNIREYQTLSKMIKVAKHDQQLQQQFPLRRRIH